MSQNIQILATGGTIAGRTSSATDKSYAAGSIGVDALLDEARNLGLPFSLEGEQVCSVGSQDIGWPHWQALHEALIRCESDAAVDGVVITHGTDTAEETAFLLDLTHQFTKPIVLTGAMRPPGVLGSEGARNLANALRLASDPYSAGRGVLVVMSDHAFAARDIRKCATQGVAAFDGFPRGPLAALSPAGAEWLCPPVMPPLAGRFPWPKELPLVDVIYGQANMDCRLINAAIESGAKGLVLAGVGQGNAPQSVLERLSELVSRKIPVVRASRVNEGFVERNVEVADDAYGFIAARTFSPQKARLLLQLQIAAQMDDTAACQAMFDQIQ